MNILYRTPQHAVPAATPCSVRPKQRLTAQGKQRAEASAALTGQQQAPQPGRRSGEPAAPGRRRSNTGVKSHPGRSVAPERRAAVEQLLRITQTGAYAGLVSGRVEPSTAGSNAPALSDDADGNDWLAETVAETALSGDDAARARRRTTSLVANVMRWQRRLDFIIDTVSRVPSHQLEPVLRAVLQVAVWEIEQRDLPAHAISEHVGLVTEMALAPHLTGYANGVLRSLLRMRAKGALPEPPMPRAGMPLAEAADALGIAASHPTWLVQRWLQRFGQADTLALLQRNNSQPVYGVRVRQETGSTPKTLAAQLAAHGVQAEPSSALPKHFLRITSGLQQVLQVAADACQVQDEAAGLVVLLLDPQPGERILDACAAPGGKAMFAASLMQGQGQLVAMDVNANRVRALASAAARQGASHVVTAHAMDLRTFAAAQQGDGPPTPPQQQPAAALFDRVLLDVPCSGFGVLSKRADLRWRRQPEDLRQLVRLQAELLAAAARLVRPGGLLVYSTCSIEPEENEQQVQAFLASHAGFSQERAPPGLVPDAMLTRDGCLATLPHVHGMDGAFAARLRRTGGHYPLTQQLDMTTRTAS